MKIFILILLSVSVTSFRFKTDSINQIPAIRGCKTPAEDPQLDGCKVCVEKWFRQPLTPADPKKPNYQMCSGCPWLCKTCDSTTKCTSCLQGNVLLPPDKEGKIGCDICAVGCLECEGNINTCKACSPRFYLVGAVCKIC